MLVPKILAHTCMIIFYIVEENIFVVIVCSLLTQKKYYNFILMIASKLIVNKRLRCLKTMNMLDSKNIRRKQHHRLLSMQILKVFQCRKIIESKIQISLIQTDTKNMLLVVTAINQHVLMINVVSILSHTQAKILFTTFLIVWSKKANTVVM